MNERAQKIRLSEKIGYAVGDAGLNLVFSTIATFLMFFLTDIFGVSTAAIVTLFLVTRMWDAVNDPIMGAIADRTKTRWGKYRPYLLWMAVPVAITFVLLFSAPNLSSMGKIIWVWVIYILMELMFTMVDIPYQSLLPMMTSDNSERNSLSAFRVFSMMLIVLFLNGATLPLVKILGGANQARGYQLTMIIYAFLFVALLLITFFTVKERVKPVSEAHATIKEDLKNLGKNRPLWILFLLFVFLFLTLSFRNTVILYYFTYNVGNQSLATPFMILGPLGYIIAMFFARLLPNKIGRKNTLIMCSVISVIGYSLFYFVNPQNIAVILILQFITSFFFGLPMPLLFTMSAEVVDYSEWKHKVRAPGIIASAASFSRKFGLAIGTSITAWILGFIGYIPNVTQTARSLLGIKVMMSLIPAAGCLIFLILVFFYPINEKVYAKICSDLNRPVPESYSAKRLP